MSCKVDRVRSVWRESNGWTTGGRRRRGWAETWTVVRAVLIVLGALGALRVVYQLGTIIL
jgi:hypothetical protein